MSSFMQQIVLFGSFWCAPSCIVQKSCFLVLSFWNKCAFWCSPSCQKSCSRSCFLVSSFMQQIVLFGSFWCAPLASCKNRAVWCFPSWNNCAFRYSPSCQKPCSRSCFFEFSFVQKKWFVLLSFVQCFPLSGNRGLDRAFWCSHSCKKSWFGEDYAKMKARPCKIVENTLEDPRKNHGKWSGTSHKWRSKHTWNFPIQDRCKLHAYGGVAH